MQPIPFFSITDVYVVLVFHPLLFFPLCIVPIIVNKSLFGSDSSPLDIYDEDMANVQETNPKTRVAFAFVFPRRFGYFYAESWQNVPFASKKEAKDCENFPLLKYFLKQQWCRQG